MNETTKGTFRYWMFTWNNPEEDWVQTVRSFKADYFVAQLEMGKEGTRHIQGCLYFEVPCRHSGFKSKPCWIKGISSKEFKRVSNYSSKEETRLEGPVQEGNRPSVGKTRDFDQAYALASEGRLSEIDKSILIPYYQNLKRIAEANIRVHTSEGTRGIWIYGPPGTGKTHSVRSQHPDVYVKSQSKWWDCYDGQKSAVLEDLDEGGRCLGHHIKIWADKWGFIGEIKGGTVKPVYEVFFITSNYLPTQFWEGEMLAAIVRRFSFVHMPELGKVLTYQNWKDVPQVKYHFDVMNL